MDREAQVLKDRIEVAAFDRAEAKRKNGLDVTRMNKWNVAAIQAWTASTVAFKARGMLLANVATKAPKNERINTHSSIEPSWFPHVLVIL